MNRTSFSAAICAGLALVVTGCGGDGSSSGSQPPSIGADGGGTPTPSPTGGAGTTIFAAAAAGPMLARVSFDRNENGSFGDDADPLTSTAIDGRFGRSVTGITPAIHNGTVPATAAFRMEATGFDASTALFFAQMRAPAGATVISPLTALIDATGSEAEVRRALGLDAGPYALRGSVGLTTFNPALNLGSSDADTRHNAMQLTRLNLQLLAMAAVLKDTNGDPVDKPVTLLDSSGYMAQQIRATGQLDLTDPATLRALFDRSRYGYGSLPEGLDAMADFMARYNAAIPNNLANADAVRGWAWGFRFDIMVEFKTLASRWPNPNLSRITAIDAAHMRESAAYFAALRAPVPAASMAVPDYAEVLVPDDATVLTDCNGPLLQYPSCNDMSLDFTEGQTWTVLQATSSEPSSLAVDLSSTSTNVEPNFMRFRRLGNAFRGLVQVRYTSLFSNGETSESYIFVRVKERGS